MTLGTDEEFPDRADGLPGLKATYGIEFGEVKPGVTGLMYENVASGAVDVITAYTTDGRLPGLDLVLLEDDKHFFPPYFAAPVVRQELLANNPGLEEVINQLAGKIDNETMANLNYQVDVEGKLPVDVARAFLVGLGLVGAHIAL
jgi:osmoprotectant transport system substrate-binding protein